jgi:hypothetical protein
MRSAALITLMLIGGSSCDAQPPETYESFFARYAGELSATHRLPRGDDLSYWGSDQDTVFYRSQDDEGNAKAPFWTKGDFNGDGEIDRAYLLFSMDGSVSLVAFVSRERGNYDQAVLEPNADKTMGVSTRRLDSGGYALNLFRFEGHGVGSYVWRSDPMRFEFSEVVWPPLLVGGDGGEP